MVSTNPSYGPRGWRAVYVPIGIIFLGLGVLIILPVLLLSYLGIHLDMRGRTLVGLAGTFVAEMILFGFLLRWLKGQGRSLRDIGWNQPTTFSAILLGIIFAIGYAAYTLSNPLIGSHVTEVSLFKLAGIVVGITGALVEECVFRGYLITELQRIRVPTIVQIIISGISFGIIHIGFDLIGVLLTFIMGTVMALAYVIGKRSLTPSLISHMVINILVEPWLLLFIITMYSKIGQLIIR